LSERGYRLYSHEIPEVVEGLRLRLEVRARPPCNLCGCNRRESGGEEVEVREFVDGRLRIREKVWGIKFNFFFKYSTSRDEFTRKSLISRG
jgi:hypothetical protein